MTHDGFHLATAHQLAVDHHHHDAFRSHFEHEDRVGSNLHLSDNFQAIGLPLESPSAVMPLNGGKQQGTAVASPIEVFLEGLCAHRKRAFDA